MCKIKLDIVTRSTIEKISGLTESHACNFKYTVFVNVNVVSIFDVFYYIFYYASLTNEAQVLK